jgi:hypothetical protein
MPLWMSEVGSGGTGISGNLSLTQKLMDDIRYIRPEAWIDWQYMEEGNDQWCMINGNFTTQSYQKVKNFYIRQQLSRYILKGSRFLSVPNDQMLAALSPTGDSLILVTLNNSAMKVYHQIDMRMFKLSGRPVSVTRTSETENNSASSNYVLKDSNLILSLPPYSITTVVIPLSGTVAVQNGIRTGTPYLILSRTANLPMRSTDENVTIDAFIYGDSSQLWTLTAGATGYSIRNLAGRTLTDAGVYNSVASLSNLSSQLFNIESVGDGCYRVLSQRTGNALDLSGESNAAGTKVGLYAYGSSPAASHRQWMFVLPPGNSPLDNPSALPLTETKDALRAFDAGHAIEISKTSDIKAIATVFSLTGNIMFQKEIRNTSTRIPVQPGVYIVSCMPIDGGKSTTSKVMVH